MSTTFYRQKNIYYDGLLIHIINTKGRAYFSLSNEHREAGLYILKNIGSQFCYNACEDSIDSIEIPLDDILDAIQMIDNYEFNNFSQKTMQKVRDDLVDMKKILEKENENLFILYCL